MFKIEQFTEEATMTFSAALQATKPELFTEEIITTLNDNGVGEKELELYFKDYLPHQSFSTSNKLEVRNKILAVLTAKTGKTTEEVYAVISNIKIKL